MSKDKPNPAQQQLLITIESLNTIQLDKFVTIYYKINNLSLTLESIIKKLKYRLKEKELVLDECLSIVRQLDSFINQLGSLTLYVENEKTTFTEEFNREILQEKIWKIIEISGNAANFAQQLTDLTKELLEGNTLFNLLHEIGKLKEKAWRSLEAVEEYCKEEFKVSIW